MSQALSGDLAGKFPQIPLKGGGWFTGFIQTEKKQDRCPEVLSEEGRILGSSGFRSKIFSTLVEELGVKHDFLVSERGFLVHS